MQENTETPCGVVTASENASTPLDSVDVAFDDVPFLETVAVTVPHLLVFAAGRDDYHHLRCEQVSLWVGIVASIGNDGVKTEGDEQRPSLGHLIMFIPSQVEL